MKTISRDQFTVDDIKCGKCSRPYEQVVVLNEHDTPDIYLQCWHCLTKIKLMQVKTKTAILQ